MNKIFLLVALMLHAVMANADSLPELDSTAAEAYTDSMIQSAMRTSGVPGVIVTVVTEDEVILSKGYGVADVESKIPVDAGKTLFNLASIGKTFTAILVLQLVEEGILDLNEDVNKYLEQINVKVTGSKLTLHHLLTHQAGFDVNLTHLFVDLNEDAGMTTAEINRRLYLLHEPGVIIGYDNIGYGVLGLIVSAVSGKPFAQLMQEKIFSPLHMAAAVYVTPDMNTTNLARCYIPLGPGRVKPCPEYPVYRELIRGAGGAAVSADSMARYMMMLLNRGELDGVRILSPQSFTDLTNFDHYRFHPALPGLARAFTELNNTDRPEYAHSGTVPGFKSFMKLFPEAGMGILISVMGSDEASFNAIPSVLIQGLANRPESKEVTAALINLYTFTDKFADEFVPTIRRSERAAKPEAVSVESDDIDARELAGRYYNPMDSKSLLGHLYRLTSGLRIEAIDANSFSVSGMGLDALGRIKRVAPLLYSSEQGYRIAFADTAMGHAVAIGTSPGTFVKLPWYLAAPWTIPLFLICFLILFSSIVYLLSRYAGRRRQTAMLILAGVGLTIAGLFLDMEYGVWFKVVQGQLLFPILWSCALHLGIALVIAASVLSLKVWNKRSEPYSTLSSVVASCHDVLLAITSITMFAVLCMWGVIGQV